MFKFLRGCFFFLLILSSSLCGFSYNDLHSRINIQRPVAPDRQVEDLLEIINRLEREKTEMKKERDALNCLFVGITDHIEKEKQGGK